MPMSEPMMIRLVKSVSGLVESVVRIEKKLDELENRIKSLEYRLGGRTVKEEEDNKPKPISEDERLLEEEDSDISF